MEGALDPGFARVQFEAIGSNIVMGAREARRLRPARRVPTSSCEGDSRTSGSRSCRWRVPRSPSSRATTATATSSRCTSGARCRTSNRGGVAGDFGLEPDSVRLIAPHVGGSFGAKHWAPEDIVAVRVALELGRPVKWIETRSENMIAMPHGRGQVQYLELGLRHDGTIVGLRCRVIGDAGAYAGFGGMLAFGPTRMMSQGVYRIPKVGYDVAVVVTNLAPMGAYRGAGRPEAAAMLERILDMAAAELGMDPVDLRRRNFLQPDEFPYATATGCHLRRGRLRRRAHRGTAHRGLRGAARRAAGAPRARRREAARHRHQRLRRDHRGRIGDASTPRSRCTPTAARR